MGAFDDLLDNIERDRDAPSATVQLKVGFAGALPLYNALLIGKHLLPQVAPLSGPAVFEKTHSRFELLYTLFSMDSVVF